MHRALPDELLAGRYRLQATIGRGGMGAAWLAADELLGREVTVKEIVWQEDVEDAERESLRERAFAQARAAAQLHHPNIAEVLDVIDHDGGPWVVMQLLHYRSLRDAVGDSGPLSTRITAEIGLGVLAAISAGHSAGVLHQDVKPANVLLGPGRQVVLTDFGLAMSGAISGNSASRPTSGVLMGSLGYMAPEIVGGERATPATDLWSLGATLYATVEGKEPFARDTTAAVLAAIVTDDPDPPVLAGPLWPVISGLLRKDPWARLDAAQAEDLLRAVADGEVIQGDATEVLPASSSAQLGSDSAGVGSDEPENASAWTDSSTWQPWSGAWRWLAPLIAGFLVIAVMGVGLGLLASRHSGRPTANATARTNVGGASSSARRNATSSPTSTAAGPGGIPVGYVLYHDPSGFAIGVPEGWHASHQGHLVYVTPPSGGEFLLVDQTTHPQSSALADWRAQEAARISSYPDYHRVRLQAVHYAQAEQAADWEFTYYRAGQPTHVLNRNILVDSHRAYALYWSVPASQWAADFHYFQVFAATFRPAP